jgi:acyl-CoA synthetase (AMP-forming)/AMP-acid ligase II
MGHATHTNIVDLLTARAAEHPERVALRFLSDGETVDTEFTYGSLHARVSALAAELEQRARPGERALLLYPSGPDYVTALLACFYAGVVAVPAYPPQSLQAQHVARVTSIARDAQPTLLLTQQALLAPLTMLKQAFAELSRAEAVATDSLVSHGAHSRSVNAGGLAMLQYTSGSTSTPKGVMLSHANLMANERVIRSAFSIQPDDVIVSWLPLFHDMGLIGTLLQPLYCGVSAVLMPQQRFLERPRRWLEAISRHRGTVSGAPDFAYRLCIQRGDAPEAAPLDLSSWRLAFSGAEPVRAQTLRAFADRFHAAGFDPAALYACYGLAEASLLVASNGRGTGVKTSRFAAQELTQNRAVPDADGPELVSCGKAWPDHEFLIADPVSGAALGAGEVGEILVHGPSIAQGYYQNPEASERTFVRRGERSWLRTGDLGFVHQEELFVTGRLKDMIIVRGQNLYPQDIERAVEEQNEVVRKGRVIAFGLEHAGQESLAVAAEISPRMRKLVDVQSVCAAVLEQVAQASGVAPALVVLLDAGTIPLTSSGKLQRSACKQAWQTRTLQVIASHGPAAIA